MLKKIEVRISIKSTRECNNDKLNLKVKGLNEKKLKENSKEIGNHTKKL